MLSTCLRDHLLIIMVAACPAWRHDDNVAMLMSMNACSLLLHLPRLYSLSQLPFSAFLVKGGERETVIN